MSFLSILKKVGSVALGIEHLAAPIVSALVPGSAGVFAVVDSITARVQNSITTQEFLSPTTGSGPQRAAAVVQDFENLLNLSDDVIAPILAARGEVLSYDHAALQTAIDAQVAAYNAFAALKASIKIVPLVKA